LRPAEAGRRIRSVKDIRTKALVLREHGDDDELRIETDFPDPVAGRGEVAVRVRASSPIWRGITTSGPLTRTATR
jgi:hypothetical protein